jgi:hypothetical protein
MFVNRCIAHWSDTNILFFCARCHLVSRLKIPRRSRQRAISFRIFLFSTAIAASRVSSFSQVHGQRGFVRHLLPHAEAHDADLRCAASCICVLCIFATAKL